MPSGTISRGGAPRGPSLSGDRDDIAAGSAGDVLERALRGRTERQAIPGRELVRVWTFPKRETAIEHPDLLMDEV
jgi:hypothetical protein